MLKVATRNIINKEDGEITMNKTETKALIQELLDEKNLSHKDLAAKMGITKFALSKILSNKQKMYLSDFMTLFEYLGLLFNKKAFSIKSLRRNYLKNADIDEKQQLLSEIYKEFGYTTFDFIDIMDTIQILEYISNELEISSFNEFKILYEKCNERDLLNWETEEKKSANEPEEGYFRSAKEYIEYLQLKTNLEYYQNQYTFKFDDIPHE